MPPTSTPTKALRIKLRRLCEKWEKCRPYVERVKDI
ncbi:predicted protein [Plenodomus lingam JN3]|uniref:Predicted protein n=1 Tax=Leptosphaeria maculans (strain JN3 / isolate v23.1.3 / race Av1-4-5-6-7-8) TaxID=985895 RepID=E5A2Z7_LEPMJ|nr:predicted protein [Plenodomus lingam JN3]CBX98010.1 predicted protein [Plenodomus lingam JN3]